VVFEQDGSISVPAGIPKKPDARTLEYRQTDINTIEVGPNPTASSLQWVRGVRLVMNDGMAVNVGGELHEGEARRIAVGLSNALLEMKANNGKSEAMRNAARYYGAGPGSDSDSDLID